MVTGGFRLDLLLETAGLARSTYYYQLKQLDGFDKDKELKAEIQSIYCEHKGNYGYRRMTLELRNRGFMVNHKKVQRLMKVLGLSARIRRKRKYSSYQGEVGKKAENLIQRQFEASKPMEKCYTDVTEFAIPASSQKLYLSPVLDGFNSEIIAYNLSTSPNLAQVKMMLEQAFTEKYYEKTILHSDQGWQYQHDFYHHFLEEKGIQPSMSRKGNSPDNGMMESFFGILKSEMFYGYEKTFKSIEHLEQAIVDYINYYNNKRIKIKLKRVTYLVDKLTKLANQSYCAVKKTSPVIEEVKYYAGELLRLSEHRQGVVEEMVTLAQSLPEYEILLSIPGIAETTATSIIGELGDIRRFHSANQINAFIGIDLRHYESGNFLAKEHITKRGNPYARKILFKCIHNIASASHTNPCHIADFYEKRKRQSQVTSTKPHTIASIHRLIRTMYYLITHNKLYDYTSIQNR